MNRDVQTEMAYMGVWTRDGCSARGGSHPKPQKEVRRKSQKRTEAPYPAFSMGA